jgi:hypothetical protein
MKSGSEKEQYMTFEQAAKILVNRIILEPRAYRPRPIYLSFLDSSRKPTVPYHWQNKNMFGVSYKSRRC